MPLTFSRPNWYRWPLLLGLMTITLMVINLDTTAVAQEATPLFVNVTQTAGLGTNRVGSDKVIGQAWGDYDNDGWPDLYVTDHAGQNTLYHNEGNGRFTLSPLSAQVALTTAYSSGATFIDYDNDGWRDLYVLNWGPNVLYRNINGTQFVDVTATAGIGDPGNSKTASWGDFDQNGHLDLYVANWSCYPDCGRPTSGDRDHLYQSNGDGTFTDISAVINGKNFGAGFVATFTDYDNDNDLDIYLVNDEFINPVGNALWRNDGAGCDPWCFTELSAAAGADTKVMGMGLATADYDNDGDQDFYFSNAGPMTLLQNQGNGTFTDVAPHAGVDIPTSIGWGAVFFDYDNDGWLDLYLAVSEAANRAGTAANPLFHNNSNGTFTDVSALSGANDTGSTLGVATADYDRDGRVDLLIGNTDTGYLLYHNESPAGRNNHWLTLNLIGGGPVNRDAVGTRVYLTTADGQTIMREVTAGSSLGAGNDLPLHFGLGRHTAIQKLVVRWPDGHQQSYTDMRLDRHLSLSYQAQPSADAQPDISSATPSSLMLSLLFAFIVLIALIQMIGTNKRQADL